jgi:hypothetical protein
MRHGTSENMTNGGREDKGRVYTITILYRRDPLFITTWLPRRGNDDWEQDHFITHLSKSVACLISDL